MFQLLLSTAAVKIQNEKRLDYEVLGEAAQTESASSRSIRIRAVEIAKQIVGLKISKTNFKNKCCYFQNSRNRCGKWQQD
jgi:hypothetical protein